VAEIVTLAPASFSAFRKAATLSRKGWTRSATAALFGYLAWLAFHHSAPASEPGPAAGADQAVRPGCVQHLRLVGGDRRNGARAAFAAGRKRLLARGAEPVVEEVLDDQHVRQVVDAVLPHRCADWHATPP